MKKGLLCIGLLLALTACAPPPSPVVSPSVPPVPSQQTVPPTPGPTSEPAVLELRYQTERVYDPEEGTQRTTLDPQGLNLSVYYEIPVFEERTDGYQKINAFLEQLRDDFFTPENSNLVFAWECALEPVGNSTYQYEITGVVNTNNEKLVSVSPCYYWIMGGVQDYGSESYTFRTDTGGLLCLTDLLAGTEDELKELILAACKEQIDESRYAKLDKLADYALDQFEFYVHQGKVWVHFDKYEIAQGASGEFFVELPAELKAEWNEKII